MIKNMKRNENIASSPPMPDSIVTSNSPPPPAAFDPNLVFYNSMYDTVKKGKVGKGARKSLAESKLFGDPKAFGSFEDYGIMPSPKAKKSTKARKNAKTTTTPKTPKVRKQTSPKTKRSPRKPRAVKDPEAVAAARRKKALAVANKSPRKTKKQQQLELLDYTTQHNVTSVISSTPVASPTTAMLSSQQPPSATTAVASNDIDDAEAAYILSSISQRSFHSYNQKNSTYQHFNIPLDQEHNESPSIIYYSQKDAPPIGGCFHKYFDNGSRVLYHVMLDHNYNAETPGAYHEEPTSCVASPATLTDPMSFLYEVAMNVLPAAPSMSPQPHPTVIVSPKSAELYAKSTKNLSSMSLPLCQESSAPSPSINCTERSKNYTLTLNDSKNESPIQENHTPYDYFQTMPLDSTQKSTTNDTNNNKYENVVHGVDIGIPPATTKASTTVTTSTAVASNDDKFNVKKRWLRQVTEETAISPPPTDNHKAPLKKRRMAREIDVQEAVEPSMIQVNIENLINKNVLEVKEELVDAIPQIPALEVLRSLISSTPTILPVFVPKIDLPTTSKATASPVNTKKPQKTWAYKQNKRTGKLKLTYVKKAEKIVIIKDEVIADVESVASDVIVPIKMDICPKIEKKSELEEICKMEKIPKEEVIPVIDEKETKQEVVDEIKVEVVDEIKEEVVDEIKVDIVDEIKVTIVDSLPALVTLPVAEAMEELVVDEVDSKVLIADKFETAFSEEREIEKYKATIEKFTNPNDPNAVDSSVNLTQIEDVDVDYNDDDDDDDDGEQAFNENEHWENVQDFFKINLDKLSKGNVKYCIEHKQPPQSPVQRMDFINFATRSNGLMNTNITTTQVPRIHGGPLSEYYSPLDVPGRTFGGRNSSFSLYPNTPAVGNFVPVTGGLKPLNGFDSYSTLMTTSNFDTKISPTGVGAFDATRFMLNCLTPTTSTSATTSIIPVNFNNSELSEDPSWVAFSSKLGGYGKVFTKTASSDPRLNPTLVAETKKEELPLPKKKVS